MQKGIIVRLYPNKEQTILINKTIGSTRKVFNYFLDYSNDTNTTNTCKLINELSILKTTKDYEYLNEVDKFALQNSIRDLGNSISRCKKRLSSKPKFKSKKKSKESYRTNFTNNNIDVNDKHIKLPKLGYVKCSNNFKEINYKIINVTVTKTKSNKYEASIIFETNVKQLPKTNKAIGIDVGSRKIVTTSDNDKIIMPKKIIKIDKKIIRLHRNLSKKKKDSKNKEKARILLAKAYEKRNNIINNLLHQVSYKIVKENDYIYLEDLDNNKLLKIQDNKKKKRKLIESSLGKLKEYIIYKGKMYDKQVRFIDRYYPSSQICSSCGSKNKIYDKEVYTCKCCNLKIDRDYNASLNILNYGLSHN